MSGPTVPPDGGLLPVDKPEGPTSHDIVVRARKALDEGRIGHTGTLDPFASGLLILCVGAATRLSEYLTGLDKVYEATAHLGVRTDTEDREGRVVESDEAWRGLTREQVASALAELRGTHPQMPPAFSAKKRGGEAAYRKARRGEAVELESVDVTIHEIELLGLELPELRFRLRCSSGTYVRAVVRDVGELLGTAAHCSQLRRRRVGRFDVAGAVGGDALDNPEVVSRAWISPARGLTHLDHLQVDPDRALALSHGRPIDDPEATGAGPAAPAGAPGSGLVAVTLQGRLVAVGERGGGRVRPRKVFVRPEEME